VRPPPTVSVLVTTYNHADYVRECLESLAAQSFRDFEVIVTDDASPDGTADLIAAWLAERAFPAHFLRNRTNRGLCANRNSALALARGRFVCSLAGDDAYEPERIERQVAAFLEAPPEVGLVYSDMSQVDAQGRHLALSFLQRQLGQAVPLEGDIFRALIVKSFLPAPAVMVRRAALDAVGRYDESLHYEDYDMWLRLTHRFRVRYVPGRLVRYRVLSTSMSHSVGLRPAMLDSTARILESWCGRSAAAEPDRLWHLGRIQLLLGQDRAGRDNLLQAARINRSLRQHALAAMLHLPGMCAVVRRVAKIRHRSHAVGRRPFWS
jgi:glycosyltransferase involved in cell wall biosynthesis